MLLTNGDLLMTTSISKSDWAASLVWSEARYRNAVEQVSEVIFQVDSEGRWTFLNPAWDRITGYTVEETLGRSFLDMVEDDDRECSANVFAAALRGEASCAHR